MNEMTEKAALNVTFSGHSQEAVLGFVELLRQYVTHDALWHQVNEKIVRFSDNSMGSYWIGTASLVVEAKNLNTCLVQADSVKHGFIPNAEAVMTQIFSDVRVEIATDQDAATVVPLVEANKYLHNKVQELERATGVLERETFNLTQLCEGYDGQIKALTRRYEEHQIFLHDFIDFKNLIKVVRETAERVDEEILDVYPLQAIH